MKQDEALKLLGGVGLLFMGRKLPALAMLGAGLSELEKRWRREHPEVWRGLEARWRAAVEHYERTHENSVNRALHLAGIPLIVGGAAGLLLDVPMRPWWLASAAAFALGWALSLVGHAVFEKSSPAFADDPLSFLAGPVWELRRLFGGRSAAAEPAAGEG